MINQHSVLNDCDFIEYVRILSLISVWFLARFVFKSTYLRCDWSVTRRRYGFSIKILYNWFYSYWIDWFDCSAAWAKHFSTSHCGHEWIFLMKFIFQVEKCMKSLISHAKCLAMQPILIGIFGQIFLSPIKYVEWTCATLKFERVINNYHLQKPPNRNTFYI